MSNSSQPPVRIDAVHLGVLVKMLSAPEAAKRDIAVRALKDIVPENITPHLSDPRLPSEAIEYFTRHTGQRKDWIEALLKNPTLPDEDRAVLAAADAAAYGEKTDTAADEENLSLPQRIQRMNVGEKVKTAMKGDKEARGILIKDTNRDVYMAVLKNPGLKENEIEMLTKNTGTNQEILRAIANNREWVANRNILHGLVMNPKTPVSLSIRFLSRMGRKDMEFIAKSRSLPVALRNNAKRILTAKQKGK
ncbi:MAG: hypothetical protein PVJ01_06335 [Pseudomonadota bacterium]|jgi:hypothetical protein